MLCYVKGTHETGFFLFLINIIAILKKHKNKKKIFVPECCQNNYGFGILENPNP